MHIENRLDSKYMHIGLAEDVIPLVICYHFFKVPGDTDVFASQIMEPQFIVILVPFGIETFLRMDTLNNRRL